MDINIIIGFASFVVAVSIGYYQLVVIPKKEIKDSKVALTALFQTSQITINEFIKELKEYVAVNGGDEIFSDGITMNGYIRYLEDLESKELSNTLITNITNEDLSKDIIATMTERLNQQIHSFNKSIAYFQTRFKYR